MRRRYIVIGLVVVVLLGLLLVFIRGRTSKPPVTPVIAKSSEQGVSTLSDGIVLVYDSSLWKDGPSRAAPIKQFFSNKKTPYSEVDLASFTDPLEKKALMEFAFGAEEGERITEQIKFQGACAIQRIAVIKQEGEVLEIRSPLQRVSTFPSQQSVEEFWQQTQKDKYKYWVQARRKSASEAGSFGSWVSNFISWIAALPYSTWAWVVVAWVFCSWFEGVLEKLFLRKENPPAQTTNAGH